MNYIAQWGSKGFTVSPDKIVPFDLFTYSVALKSDSENDTSGKSPTNTRGLELKTISLSTTYVKSAGVDPRGQIAEWEALVGSSFPLFIGGERFGPNRMKLIKIDVADLKTNNSGVFLMCNVAMAFEEDPATEKNTTTENSKKSLKEEITTALEVTPTGDDKKEKKQKYTGGGSRWEHRVASMR